MIDELEAAVQAVLENDAHLQAVTGETPARVWRFSPEEAIAVSAAAPVYVVHGAVFSGGDPARRIHGIQLPDQIWQVSIFGATRPAVQGAYYTAGATPAQDAGVRPLLDGREFSSAHFKTLRFVEQPGATIVRDPDSTLYHLAVRFRAQVLRT